MHPAPNYCYPFYSQYQMPKTVIYPYQAQQQQYPIQGFPGPFFYSYPYQAPRFVPPVPVVKQREIVIIDSDDDEIVPPPVQAPIVKKPARILDLDLLEDQGRIYEHESSESPLPRRRTEKFKKYEPRYESPKPKKRIARQKKIYVKKEDDQFVNHEKDLRIGREYQAQIQPKQAIKTRLIRIYQKDPQFETLKDSLRKTYENCNDEDVARVLNIAGKDYQKAEQILNENETLLQYYFQTYFQKILSTEERSTFK